MSGSWKNTSSQTHLQGSLVLGIIGFHSWQGFQIGTWVDIFSSNSFHWQMVSQLLQWQNVGFPNEKARSMHVGAREQNDIYNSHNIYKDVVHYFMMILDEIFYLWTLDCIFIQFSQISEVTGSSSVCRPSFALVKVSDSSNLLVAATLKPAGHSTFHDT